jgi:hypothetical protein
VTVLAEFNAFHGIGAAFAVWAVIVSVLGMRRADFPSGDGASRAVMAITALLLAGTIGAAIATSEKHEGHKVKGSSHGDRANPTHEGEPPENTRNEPPE